MKRKIILRSGQAPGDVLTLTRAVADLKETYPEFEIDIRCSDYAVWENNPRLTKLSENDPEVEIYDVQYEEIHISGTMGMHWTDAFRHDLEFQLKVKIKKTGIRPELWISEQERSWFNQVHCTFSDDSPYWVINAGRKQDNELKFYHRWQEVVNLFNECFKGKVTLVQMGHKDHIHFPLDGVYNLIGQTDTRQLIRLIDNAHGTIGPLSFQFVISAALERPAVCVAAGKEGVRWHLYPQIRYLYTNGALFCCKYDGCWLGGNKGQCKNLISEYNEFYGTIYEDIPKCFSLIKPYQIVDAIKMYYEGDRLKMPESEMKFTQSGDKITYLKDIKKESLITEEKINIKNTNHFIETDSKRKFLPPKMISIPAEPKIIQSYKERKLIDYIKPGEKILIRFGHGLGDTLMFMPVFYALQKKFPDTKFDIYLECGQEEIFESWPDKEGSLHDRVFHLDYKMSEGTDQTKNEKCCKEEIGISLDELKKLVGPIDDIVKLRADYTSPFVAVHFQGTSLPDAVNCPIEIADKIWKEIIEAGKIPIECHFNHIFHNPKNIQYYICKNRHVRDCTATLQNLFGLLQHSYAFIGVASGPWVAARSIMPTYRTLYLQKEHSYKNYIKQEISMIDVRYPYIDGCIKIWLNHLK